MGLVVLGLIMLICWTVCRVVRLAIELWQRED